MRRNLDKINTIIIHHSETDVHGHDDIEVIRVWHKAKGWSDVGYHYFIRKDGLAQKGRDLDVVGAHCKGKNSSSLGICLSGDTRFTEKQFLSLAFRIKLMEKILGRSLKVEAHSKYNENKECPKFDVEAFKEKYL